MIQHRLTFCIVSRASSSSSMLRCVQSVLEHVPTAAVELRLGFTKADHGFYHLLGALCPDRVVAEHQQLPSGIERFSWTRTGEVPIRTWTLGTQSDRLLPRAILHDVPLATPYVVHLADSVSLQTGWWNAIAPLLDDGAEFIGMPSWHEYAPQQMEDLQNFAWYMGVPFERRDSRSGISFMNPNFMVLKSEGLQQAGFPDSHPMKRRETDVMASDAVLLGEIAHQLGWKMATFAEHIASWDTPK
jgi:hypothetical protein